MLKTKLLLICAGLILTTRPMLSAETTEAPATSFPSKVASVATESGVASYYADRYHGRRTANGEIFDTYKLTAAHGKLPFGTLVKVTNTANDTSVIVRINDRGPFVSGRVIDLSRAAAKQLGMEQKGLAQVRIEVLPATTATPQS